MYQEQGRGSLRGRAYSQLAEKSAGKRLLGFCQSFLSGYTKDQEVRHKGQGMKNKKIATPTEVKAVTSTANNSVDALETEYRKVFEFLLAGNAIDADYAHQSLGVKHLHSIIPKIEHQASVERMAITRPHPASHKLREINQYWIDQGVIEQYQNPSTRAELRAEQEQRFKIKSLKKANKIFNRLCSFCSEETMLKKVREFYHPDQAA